MNRELALAEWRHARQALRAAEILLREELRPDAVSRAYYGILHAAKAALHVNDIGADSHAAVKRLFGLHLIRSGAIEAEWSAHLGRSLEERLAADYDAEATFSTKEARYECQRARKFVGRIRRYLLANGFTQKELRQERPVDESSHRV
jgi:uncharacterized protein (UPF0332 family)